MSLMLNDGTITFIGFPPPETPYMSAISVVMGSNASGRVPEAAMFTVTPFCAAEGFLTWKENMYSVLALTIWPV
jgi:hypothetical protein